MTQEIVDLFDTYHYGALQRMAEIVGLDRELAKDDLVAEMTASYFTERRIRASLMLLDDTARAVFVRLRQLGGEMATRQLRETLLDEGLVEEPGAEGGFLRGRVYGLGAPYADGNYVGKVERGDSPVFEDVMARLALHGLVFSRDTGNSYSGYPYKVRLHPGATVFIPEAVKRHLPHPEEGLPTPPVWEPQRVETGAPDVLLRDLYLTWDLARRSDIRLIQSGFVGKRSLRAINEALLVPDATLETARREDEARRLHLLCRLLEALGLVQRTADHLLAVEPEGSPIPAFWGWSPGNQVLACLDAWESLGGAEGPSVQIGEYFPRYAQARSILRSFLAELNSEVWFRAEDLLSAIQEEHDSFLFSTHFGPQRSRDNPYGQAYGRSGGGTQFYQRTELRFVKRCLRGFLHEAGVVALGYEADEVRRFGVTEAGRALLNGERPQSLGGQAAGAGKVVVQPTFDVIAMGPLGLDIMARLDLCAERQRVDRAVFEYRLSRTSLDEARRWGVPAEQVIEFLEAVSETSFPQNVRRTMDSWARMQERILFRRAVDLLETAGEDELKGLIDDPEIGPNLARAVAPNVALLEDGRRGALVEALIKRGYLPVTSDARPDSADDSVFVHEDGLIEALHTVPGFLVRSRVERLAEPEGDLTWRLTPRSLGRAGGGRECVLDLLRELERLHCGRLPDGLRQWVKAEGQYYGSAVTETLTLVAFHDREALDELRAEDPEVAALLTPFEAGDRALAVVATERLPDVAERLAAFGVEVRDGAISST